MILGAPACSCEGAEGGKFTNALKGGSLLIPVSSLQEEVASENISVVFRTLVTGL